MVDKDYVCEDWGEENEWTQIKVTVKLPQLDELSSVMSMYSNYLQIEDYSDIDLKTCYGDLIDESILNADKTIASVSVYLAGKGHADTVENNRCDCLAVAAANSTTLLEDTGMMYLLPDIRLCYTA